jgi:gliding motility-associated-like protein
MWTKTPNMKKYPFFSLLVLAFWPVFQATLQQDVSDQLPETAFFNPPPGDCDTLLCGMAIITCHADTTDLSLPVAGVVDARFNSLAPIGDDWTNPQGSGNQANKFSPPTWSVGNLGQIFGTAIDPSGNVFLAASDVYAFHGGVAGFPSRSGSAGTAGIYRANGNCLVDINPLVTTKNMDNDTTIIGTNQIPNTGGLGNGIGNLAYDPLTKNLYASNLEDGRIYRIDPTSGIVLSVFDPFAVDVPGSPGMVDAAERIWGVAVYDDPNTGENRLFFDRDGGYSSSFSSTIYSVEIDASGEFVATSLGNGLYGDPMPDEEIIDVNGIQYAVTDIAFSRGGDMLVAERGGAHIAWVSLYKKVAGIWTFQYPYFVGEAFGGDNSAGGVDFTNSELNGDLGFGCDSLVWATGNYLMADQVSDVIYGMQGIPLSGNAAANNGSTDIFVDFDGLYGNNSDKGGVGDVEFLRCDCTPPNGCDGVESFNEELGGDQCCYAFGYFIPPAGNMDTITCVELEIQGADWIFNTGSLQIGGNFGWSSPPTNTVLSVGSSTPGAPLPTGVQQGVVDYCFAPANPNPSSLIVVAVKYYKKLPGGEKVLLCEQIIEHECAEGPTEDCVMIENFQVNCNPDNPYEYLFNFTVTNLSTSTINQVFLQDLTANFGFSDCSSSNFLPAIALNLPGPLAPGNTSAPICVKIVSAIPILTPVIVDFRLGLISDDYCCHSATKIPLTLEPCCDPCDENGVIVNDLGNQADACCYSLDLINNCEYDFFSKVETEILTPGVLFGYHGLGGPDAGNWTIAPGSSPTSITWVPNGGSVPFGTTQDIIQFCLDDINDPSEIPQQVLVKWYTEGCICTDSLVCVDTLTFNCEIDYPCLEVSDQEIECDEDNEKYIYTFTVTNTSAIPFAATDLFVSVDAPADVILTPTGGLIPFTTPLVSGQSATVTTCIESTAGFPAPSGFAVLRYRLAFFNGASADTCCFENQVDTLFFPPCENEPADCSQIGVSNITGDSCCFTMDFDNQYPRFMRAIEIESLTPGVAFDSHFPGGPTAASWESVLLTQTRLRFRRVNMGQIPYGLTPDLINFCLDQSSLPAPPYVFEISYLNGRGEVVCTEEIELDCVVGPDPDDPCGSGPVSVNNGLTPNGDGFNDEFVVQGIDRCNGVTLTIYNRWGNIVYEQENYEVGPNWNGLGVGNNPLPDGTYFYLLTFTELNLTRNGFLDIRN